METRNDDIDQKYFDLLNGILMQLNEYAKNNPKKINSNERGRFTAVLGIANCIYKYAYNNEKVAGDLGYVEKELFPLLDKNNMQKYSEKTPDQFKATIAGIQSILEKLDTPFGNSDLRNRIGPLLKNYNSELIHEKKEKPKTEEKRSSPKHAFFEPSEKVSPEESSFILIRTRRSSIQGRDDPILFINESIPDRSNEIFSSLNEVMKRLREVTIRGSVYVLEYNISREKATSLIAKSDYDQILEHLVQVHFSTAVGIMEKNDLNKCPVQYTNDQFEKVAEGRSPKNDR